MASLKDRRLAALIVVIVAGLIAAYVTTRSSAPHRPAGAGEAASRDVPGSSSGASHTTRADRDVAARAHVPSALTGDDAIAMTVEGRVLDGATGAPQAGVEVELTLPGHEGPRAEVIATSADDGRYRAEISTGRWDIRAHGAGVWAPPTRLLIEEPTGAASVHHDVLVERTAIVRGHVRDHRGTMIASATVSVETVDATVRTALDETIGRSAITGVDGAFELTVPPGEVKLHATTSDGVEGFAAATVAPGGDVTVDLELPAPATIDGIVRGPDGAPARGATIHVYGRVLGGGADQQLTATTDSSGRYVLTTVHPGSITIEATRDGAASPPTRQQLDAGATVTIDLALGAPLALRGRVLTRDGEPVPHGRVNAVLQGSRTKLTGVSIQADGQFEMTAGLPGTYVVSATDGTAKARIVVELTADTDPFDVVLQEPGGIRGQVTLAGGAPARSATIAVAQFVRDGDDQPAPGGLAKARTLSAGDGTFSMPDLLPGVYELVITAPGRADAHVAGVVVVEAGWADVAVALTELPS